MRTILIQIVVIFLSASVLFGQSAKLDSLKNRLTTQVDQEKITTLINLTQELLQNNDIIAAKDYAWQAVRLSEQNSANLQANVLDNRGLVYRHQFDYVNAMNDFIEALKIRDQTDENDLRALSKHLIAETYLLQEDDKNAMRYGQEALELWNLSGNLEKAAETHNILGDIYTFQKLYGKAQQHYDRSFELYIQNGKYQKAAAIASLMGKLVAELGDYEGALIYFNKSLDINRSMENLVEIANDYNEITLVNTVLKDFDEAQSTNDIALNLRTQLKDKLGIAESMKNSAFIFVGKNNYAKAKINLEAASQQLTEIGVLPGTPKIYKDISDAYFDMENYSMAYQNLRKYTTSRELLFNTEKTTSLQQLETRYRSEFETEEQKQQIVLLQKEQTYSTRVRSFLMALIGLGFILLVTLFVGYKRKQKDNILLLEKNEKIQLQKEEIDAKNLELEEKNISLDLLNKQLVEEIADRESIEKSSFARNRFLATMSHEMRNPMNSILGISYLLMDESPRPDQLTHLRTLQFATNNLLVFINDVLDYSKIEAGKLEMESREFVVQDMINEIEQRFSMTAKDRNVAINYNIDEVVPTELMGDPTRFNQIISNLINSSLVYTQNGQINVSLSLEQYNPKESLIKVEVADNGLGIEEDKLNEMFSDFSKNPEADIFESDNISGLELAITKRLVDLQNGKIEAQSTLGEGTSFTVLLPFKLPITDNKSKNIHMETRNYDHLKGKKILLVEDNPINQLVVEKMLSKLGMKVSTADNGLEALDAISDTCYDLVLMDIQMPLMDGYRTTAEIRKSEDEKKRDVPIIALTASAFLSEKEKAQLFGMNDHIGKPFGPDELLEKIDVCLAEEKV